MNFTGIIKHIDLLGRVKFPKGLLKSCYISPEDLVQIYQQNNSIVVTHISNTCILCSSNENIHIFNNKPICKSCCFKILKELNLR